MKRRHGLRTMLPLTAVFSVAATLTACSPSDPPASQPVDDAVSSPGQADDVRPAPTTTSPAVPSASAPSTTAEIEVASTSPAPGSTVSGVVDLTIRDEDLAGISQLKWVVNDREVASDSQEPWARSWDSTTFANGEHDMSVRVRDAAGSWTTTSSMKIVVENDLTTEEVSPSGEAAPRDDLPGWRHVFADDFEQDVPLGEFPDAVDDRWRAYPSPWTDTSGRGQYTPERVVSVADGMLNKHIRTEDGVHLVAAMVPKAFDTPGFGSLYGRYEVRFRTDQLAAGYKVAWLLWPDSGTNTTGSESGVGGNGEIDFPEKNLDRLDVSGFVHHQDATEKFDQVGFRAEADSREWHTYTIEWSPDLVVFELDGVEVGRTTERVPDTPMHWVLQTETWLEDDDPPDDVEVNVMVDWVSMWAYDG